MYHVLKIQLIHIKDGVTDCWCCSLSEQNEIEIDRDQNNLAQKPKLRPETTGPDLTYPSVGKMEGAVYRADKVASLSDSLLKDVYILGQVVDSAKRYHRAAIFAKPANVPCAEVRYLEIME